MRPPPEYPAAPSHATLGYRLGKTRGGAIYGATGNSTSLLGRHFLGGEAATLLCSVRELNKLIGSPEGTVEGEDLEIGTLGRRNLPPP